MTNFELKVTYTEDDCFTHVVDDMVNKVEQFVDQLIEETCDKVDAEDLGIDQRCGTLFVDKERSCIIVPLHKKGTVDYYGGFEYVDSDHYNTVGDYVIYSNECERIWDHLDTLSSKE